MQTICRQSSLFFRRLAINCRPLRPMSTTGPTQDSGPDIYDPVSNEPEIPSPARVRHETVDVLRKRLLYQSRKRGILENDLILANFADKYLDTFDKRQLDMYDYIINMPSNDWELYYWSVGRKPVPDEYRNEVMELLIDHTRNKDRQSRVRQPDI